MPTDFDNSTGVDFTCLTDLDASLTLVDTRTVLGESTARRLITPRGGLFYDRDFGGCVRRFLKASGFSPSQIARTVESETEKDERVDSAAAEVTYDEQSETLEIGVRIRPVEGEEFDLTVIVDALSVELLNEDVLV